MSEERHKNDQSVEEPRHGVCESCLISFIKLKVKEYFESQSVNVLEESSWVVQQSSSISKIDKFRWKISCKLLTARAKTSCNGCRFSTTGELHNQICFSQRYVYSPPRTPPNVCGQGGVQVT